MRFIVLYSLFFVLSAVSFWYSHEYRHWNRLLRRQQLFQQFLNATQHGFNLHLEERKARWALGSFHSAQTKGPSTVWEGPDS
jgi:hypothetical protein